MKTLKSEFNYNFPGDPLTLLAADTMSCPKKILFSGKKIREQETLEHNLYENLFLKSQL